MNHTPESGGADATGHRQQKRRATLTRIADAGLNLFLQQGYETTTLDQIADAAGISRRTFFHYFRSKEEVLLAHQGSGFSSSLQQEFLQQDPEQAPLVAACDCFCHLSTRYETPHSKAADRILRSTRALQLHKEAQLVRMEETLAQAMYQLWPEPSQRPILQLQAGFAVTILRIALEDWRSGDESQPLSYHIRGRFDAARQALSHQPP